jgi:hypothetical protein
MGRVIVGTDLAIIVGLVAYKLTCVAIGTLFVLLGYRLFKAGIWGDAGNFQANFKDAKLVMKSAAPGTFFEVLGAAIVVFTVTSGLKFDVAKPNGASQPTANAGPPGPNISLTGQGAPPPMPIQPAVIGAPPSPSPTVPAAPSLGSHAGAASRAEPNGSLSGQAAPPGMPAPVSK